MPSSSGPVTLLNQTRSLRGSALVLVAGLLWLAGCGRGPSDPRGGAQSDGGAAGSGGAAGNAPTAPAPASDQTNAINVAQLTAITNQFAAAQRAQTEATQRLLARIDELEKQAAGQALAAQALQRAHEEQLKAHEARAEKFLKQVGEIETKVASLQAGRVLPEIAVRPDTAPTPRELDQKIQILERKNELAAETAEARAREAPKISAGAGGFALSSADTNFVLKLRGIVQLDSRTFFDDNRLSEGNDTFVLRRARPIVEGTLFRDFDFQFVPDFAGSSAQIFDANLNYRYRPELQLRAGKFKGPVGLENLQADATLSFNERSPVSSLVPNRNVGVQLWGDLFEGRLSYAAGVFNVMGDGRNAGSTDFGDDKEFAGRLFLQPFRKSGVGGLQGFGFGLGGSYSEVNSNASGLPSTTGGTRPGYATAGLQQFFAYNPAGGNVVADGAQWRLSPQLSYLWGPFGLLGEYAVSHQSVLNGSSLRRAALNHTAWQLTGQWMLTGEPATFTGVTPARPFRLGSGGWGAWQLVGRFGQLDIDDNAFPGFANPATSARRATSWSAGLNWWLNQNVRLMTSFSQTRFDGGGAFNPLDPTTHVPPATVTAQPENAFFTRLQLSF